MLDKAATKTDPWEQLCYVAAFTVSMYSTSSNNRATKPFNPLLGETYECDRMDDLGWRTIAEQVRFTEDQLNIQQIQTEIVAILVVSMNESYNS